MATEDRYARSPAPIDWSVPTILRYVAAGNLTDDSPSALPPERLVAGSRDDAS